MAESIVDKILQRPLHSLKKAPAVLSERSLRHNVARQFNKTWHTRNGRYDYNPEGIDIFEEDWDNLVILDACRFDFFEQAIQKRDVPGKLDSRISRGSQTPEWLWANFAGRTLHDTVYISAGIMPYHIGVEDFDEPTPFQEKYSFDLDVFDLVNIWEDPPAEARRVYDENRIADHIIPADATAQEALEAAYRYPHKRLIIHIIPPHKPYVGPTGGRIHQQSAHPWRDTYRRKELFSYDTLAQAYEENVEHAVSAALDLVAELDGKSVISSDHGELLFDRSAPLPITEYMHPDKTYVTELVKVPWLVIESEERRSVRSGPPQSLTQAEKTKSRGQLQALGYL